jgi:hypothetical protein
MIHGTTMIFLVIVPILAGFGNYMVPLMIGARDMAFPRLNALSYWLYLLGGLILVLSFEAKGGAASAGWTSYATLSTLHSPGRGQDLWILSLHVLTLSSLAGAINFIVTISNMRARGMPWTRMPLFVWTIFTYAAAPPRCCFPRRSYDDADRFRTRYALFSPVSGATRSPPASSGLRHPEVYIIAPAMGIILEIIPVFARKPIFGYKAVALSTVAIAFLGFIVWGHHMFAVGLPTRADTFFMVSSMVIAVPTGVKIFNWLATLWRGNISFDTPMLWALGFIALFTIGGLSGIFLAAFPVDWQLTQTYYVVAHIHYVLFGGSMFGIFAVGHYCVPKISGSARRTPGSSTLAGLHRLQPGVLPAAPARVARNAEARLHVPSGRRLGGLQHDLFDRRIHDGGWDARLCRQRDQDLEERPAGHERSVGRRHARVVRDLAPAGVQLRPRAVHHQRAAAARPAPAARAGAAAVTAGPWARLLAVGAVGATALAVVSGAAGWHTAHRVLAGLALPPLIGLLVLAWVAMRRLLPMAVASVVLFGLAALLTHPRIHLAVAAAAFGATSLLAAQAFRGAAGPVGEARDYVTLTKPRVMSLLLLTGGAAVFVGASGVPPLNIFVVTMVGLALACGGAAALNHYYDRDIDKLMGARTAGRPVASGRIAPERALEFGIALSAPSRSSCSTRS